MPCRAQYTYDAALPLIGTEVGPLLPGSPPQIDPQGRLRTDTWSPDLLGNWAGGGSAAGRRSEGNLDGHGTPWANFFQGTPDAGPDTVDRTHTPNFRNEVTSIFADDSRANPPTSGTTETEYDAAGNLTFDGEFFYQYDAWGRLVQVNEASRGTGGAVELGDFVKGHAYDGLGRLIRTLSPYPEPGPTVTELRSERFYYDGIRRIQEVVLDPLSDMAAAGGDPELEEILDETTPGSEDLDADSATLGYEEGQADAPTGPVWRGTAREYIWGPGDNGVDELLVQYDEQGYEWWAIQDAGGDLVALCDLGGSGGTARVVGQWTYDAYGAVVTCDQLHPFAPPHLGHKGLFFDRLDKGVLDAGFETPRLAPFARVNYHVRNRNYDPGMGRWNQRDPNQTGAIVLDDSDWHGRSLSVLPPQFDLERLHDDGANLYEYVASDPWVNRDPLGLYLGPLDTVLMGFDVAREASAMIANYSFDLEMDADWASDWSAGDYEYSRFAPMDVTLIDGLPSSIDPRHALGYGTVFTIKNGMRIALSGGRHAMRLFDELHHLIPKLLGGLPGKAGSRYGLTTPLHQREFHKGLAELTQRYFGRHPNAGATWFSHALDKMSLTALQDFRRDLYAFMHAFDARHGTALVATFRREYRRQRYIGRVAGELPGFCR